MGYYVKARPCVRDWKGRFARHDWAPLPERKPPTEKCRRCLRERAIPCFRSVNDLLKRLYPPKQNVAAQRHVLLRGASPAFMDAVVRKVDKILDKFEKQVYGVGFADKDAA